MNTTDRMGALGRVGGLSRSPRKVSASKVNAARARLALAARRNLAAHQLSAVDEVEQPQRASQANATEPLPKSLPPSVFPPVPQALVAQAAPMPAVMPSTYLRTEYQLFVR